MVFFHIRDSFYKQGTKGLIFLIPFISLIVTPSMLFPFVTGKNFAFRILVELAAVLWLGLLAANRNYRLRNSIVVGSVMLFTFIVGLADILGVNPSKSFWSNYERMEGYVTILHLALYFMILNSILKTRKEWNVFFGFFLLTSVLVGLLAFVLSPQGDLLSFKRHMMEYGTRVYSTIGNPPFLASYLLLSVFIGIILIFNTQKKFLKFVFLLSVLFNSMVVYVTGSRGAILAGVAGIILSLFFFFGNRRVSGKKHTLQIVICLVIVMSASLLAFYNYDALRHDRTISRFTVMFSDYSSRSRLNVWKAALKGIGEKPVLGWGQENFLGIYTVNPISLAEKHIWLDRAHNIIIDWLVRAGWIGLLSYLAIYTGALFAIRTAYHKKNIERKEACILVISFIVYFIQNLFSFDTINTYIIFFALLAYIDNLAYEEQHVYSASENSKNFRKTGIIYLVATLAALFFFSFVFYYVNYKPIKQSREIIRMSHSSPEKDSYALLLSDVRNALAVRSMGDADIRNRMISISDFILKEQVFDQEGAKEFIQATIDELRKEMAAHRHDLEYMTNIIRFFKEIAAYEKSFVAWSEVIIKQCMSINPEYQWLHMAMADINVLKKDYDGAIASAEAIKGVNLQNDYYYFRLAILGIYTSREHIVDMALENVREIRAAKKIKITSGRRIIELELLASAYGDVKNYQKKLDYLKEIIDIFSQNIRFSKRNEPEYIAKFHFMLAQTYMNMGDMEKAISEANRAAELAPEYYRKPGILLNN